MASGGDTGVVVGWGAASLPAHHFCCTLSHSAHLLPDSIILPAVAAMELDLEPFCFDQLGRQLETQIL